MLSINVFKVLANVTESANAAEAIKVEVLAVKEMASQLVEVISDETAVAEGKLEEARPALEAAEAALLVLIIFFHLHHTNP